MQRRGFLAGFAAVVANGLAGCSDETSPAEETATPVPPDAVAWRDGDELNADALAESHAAALLEAGSFTVFSRADTAHSGDERPGRWLYAQTYEARFEAERERQLLEQDLLEVDEGRVAYAHADEVLYRTDRGDEVAYDRDELDRDGEAFRRVMEAEGLTGVRGLAQWNLTVNGAIDRDRRSLTRFTAERFDGERDVPRELEGAEATVLVDDEGVVRRIEQAWRGAHEGQDVEVAVDIEFRGIGETRVDEPEWADEARASGSGDGSAGDSAGDAGGDGDDAGDGERA